MIKYLPKLPAVLCCTMVLLIMGCSFDNTLYNAKKYFVSAQNRPLNQSGKPTPQAIDEYNKTIQKCGYILTERKTSREADDALFLLARALYYRGNSPYQAKDQLQSLLKNFPDSPFVPEATLYLAKVHRQINENAKAEDILSAYLLNPNKKKWHPKALLVLADFAIQDMDNEKAQFWLGKVLSQYPKSVYYKEALFLLGKNQFENKDYTNSLVQFTKVVQTRGIDRYIKNDARYYMALNLLYLNQPQKSISLAKKLSKIEDRQDRIPAINVLLGRNLLELGKETVGIELLQSVIKTNTRTLASAEAYFWLGEHYYFRKQDIQTALDNYSSVKTESAASPYADEATLKNSSLTLIKQNMALKVEANPQLFVDGNLEVADKYINVLNQPDSASVTFKKIYLTPLNLQTRIDSLVLVRDSLNIKRDTLSVKPDSASVITSAVSDSLDNKSSNSVKDVIRSDESLSIENKDSLEIGLMQPDSTESDSLYSTEINGPDKPDSLLFEKPEPATTPENSLLQAKVKFELIQKNISDLVDIKDTFIKEYIPYAKFVQAAMFYRINPADPILQSIYTDLETQYPQSKYTQATKLLLEGKAVRLVDSELEREEELIDFACANIMSEPDSSLTVLQELTQSTYKNICTQANFRLGWFYTFEQQDTIKAKPYLDEIAKLENTNEYYLLMKRFYNGTKYTINFAQDDTLSQTLSLPDSLSVHSKADSLKITSPADSTEIKVSAPEDSLSNPLTIEPILPEEKKNDDIQPEIYRPEDRLFIKPE